MGIRPKMYSIVIDESISHNKVKGIPRHISSKLNASNFKDTLYKHERITSKMLTIRSWHHELYTSELEKVVLSWDDDKRVILDDKIHSRAHGHFRLGLILWKLRMRINMVNIIVYQYNIFIYQYNI